MAERVRVSRRAGVVLRARLQRRTQQPPGGATVGPREENRPDSERDLGRLVTFTDAVVAIAITLIVLPLVESARELETQPAVVFLLQDAPNILAAALTFVVIATLWRQHHQLYQHVDVSVPGLVNANLLWLVSIIVLPVPTLLLLGNPDADSLGSSIYVVTILVAQVALRIQELLLVRHGSFEAGYEPVARFMWAHWITPALTIGALVLCIAFPSYGPSTLVLLLLSRPLNLAVRRPQTPMERRRRVL